MSLQRAEFALQNIETSFRFFAQRYGVAKQGSMHVERNVPEIDHILEEGAQYIVAGHRLRDAETAETYSLLLLAFLDAMGYSQRSRRRPPMEQFRGILGRYLHSCGKFQHVRAAQGFALGDVDARQGDARRMDIADASIDAILFSPPYSFAIDYVENDAFHLSALNVDRAELENAMIGLRGGRKQADKYACYLEDMETVLQECMRVLRAGRYCVVVIGTNINQLSKILGVSATEVMGLHQTLREQAEAIGFSYATHIPRSIKGIANTMRDEYILFLRKG